MIQLWLWLAVFSSQGASAFSLKEACHLRVKGSVVKKEQAGKYCACWQKGLAKLNAKQVQSLKPWVERKIKNSDLENRDPAMAEYIFKIEVLCLEQIGVK